MITKVLKILNLDNNEGLCTVKDSKWHGILPQRTENIIKNKLKPDAFFLLNKEPFILFFENPTNKEQIFKNSWNLNQTPIIFIIQDGEIEIYNGLSYLKEEKRADKLSSENWEENYSFFNIVSGKTWEQVAKEEFTKKSVDEKLLENIKAVRNLLKDIYKLPTHITNSLIGRLIFIRYLIDREVVIVTNEIEKNDKEKYKELLSFLETQKISNGKLSNNNLCSLLKDTNITYQLFEYIKDRFNGNLFPILQEEKDNVEAKHLEQLINLLQGTEISSGQMSLFDVYDFSIIPIELVSNVYEFFIGQAEQEEKGAYYTPLFLVNNVLSETVNTFFDKTPEAYNCKTLDPACGSGVFLVETLRKILSQHQKNTPDYHIDVDKYKSTVKNLLTNNIYGIDKDPNALNVAIFSLYVTLLDYLQPPEIVNLKFPPLLNKNFFVADFFDLDADFNKVLSETKFDFIIGNPPWGKIRESETLYEDYWKTRETRETKIQKENNPEFKGKVEIKVSRKEIAQVFLIRVSDFNFDECAFIVTSKILYNLKANKFRKYFLENFTVRKVFELSSVRHEIFDKSNDPSDCPASIVYYSYSPDKEKNKQNIITHISLKPNRFFELFKMFTVEKHDQKQLYQSYFMDDDWIWKVLVYGNILDFYFIKRLKSDYKKIKQIINNKKAFLIGQGIMVGGGDENPVPYDFIGLPYIDASKGDITQFHVKRRRTSIWKEKIVHRPRDPQLFEAPALLITGGTNKYFKSVSAISYTKSIFRSSLTAVKAKSLNDIEILKTLNSLLNSNLFAFYITAIGSSIGIEREETHDDEKFSFPYNSSKKIVELVSAIEKAAKQKYEAEDPKSDIYRKAEIEYDQLIKEIDKEIYSIYKINKQEQALIDYTHEISIPLIKRRDTHRIFGSLHLHNEVHKKYIKQYADIFINHYNNIFNSDGLYFEVEVWHSKHIIGMLFKVIHEPSKADGQIVWKQDTETRNLLKRFSAISISRQSEELFIQKDIKGFEEEAFYVVKPNEYKNWHRALAHLDLSEFIDAMMRGAKEEFAG